VLGAVLLGTFGSVAANAAVVDFSVEANGGTLSYTSTAGLALSTAFNFDSSTLTVDQVFADDTTGITSGTLVSLVPTNIVYGSTAGGTVDVTKSFTVGTTDYTETLTTVEDITRGLNSIDVTLTGTITGGAFSDTPVTLTLAATQTGGPGHAISVSLTDFGSTVPEPSTWAMLMLGFAGLGYAAFRRNSKARALAV